MISRTSRVDRDYQLWRHDGVVHAIGDTGRYLCDAGPKRLSFGRETVTVGDSVIDVDVSCVRCAARVLAEESE